MNNNDTTKKIYFWLYTSSIVFTLFIVEFFQQYDINSIKILNSIGINLKTDFLINLIEFLTHWFLFTLLYLVIFKLTLFIYKIIWKLFNSDIYIGGTWLHIHDKKDVKIGVVKIKQDFYDLSVIAENILPQSNDDKRTRWHYIGTEFRPDINATIQLIGCYFAQRENEPSKQGIHMFTDFSSSKGRVVKMIGKFGDSINTASGYDSVATHDKTGKILLFRMDRKLRKYIDFKSIDSYRRKDLRWIINENKNQYIYNSEYVKTLKNIYYKNEFQKQLSTLRKLYENGVTFDLDRIETVVFNMLAYAMFADNEVDKIETETLKALTGLTINLTDHPVLKKDVVLSDIREVLTDLLPHNEILRLFKSMLNHSCRSIISCNSCQSVLEESFLNDLEETIRQVCQAQHR